jgi:hypothetical protein
VFRIEKNANWMKMEQLFNEDLSMRFDWFLYEFGKRLTGLVLEELIGKLKNVKGTKDYQKRLAIAEIRDKGHRTWFAIAAKAKTLSQGEHDPKKSLLSVVPRFKLNIENPIEEILVNFGPWTAETIPFLPSLRQAVVVIKKSSEAKVATTKRRNLTEGQVIMSFMEKHGIELEPRFKIYQQLKVFPDLELEALRIEYGLAENSKSHWRPSISFAKRQAIELLKKDTDLIRALTDPNFKGYRSIKHVDDRMNSAEVKALDTFQTRIRKESK